MGAKTPEIVEEALASEEISVLRTELCLNYREIHLLYEGFARLDTNRRGFLELDDFAKELEDPNEDFVELPYLEHLFKLIPQQRGGRLYFEEFAPAIVRFCLMSPEEILRFVFEWVDQDGDEKLLPSDIHHAAYFRNPRTLRDCFFSNFARDFEDTEEEEPIDFLRFRSMGQEIEFLTWPAILLQQRLREFLLGTEFWPHLYSRIEKAEQTAKNNEKKFSKMKEKMEQLRALNQREATLRQQFSRHIVQQRGIGRRCKQPATDDSIPSPSFILPRRLSCPHRIPELPLHSLSHHL